MQKSLLQESMHRMRTRGGPTQPGLTDQTKQQQSIEIRELTMNRRKPSHYQGSLAKKLSQQGMEGSKVQEHAELSLEISPAERCTEGEDRLSKFKTEN
ncbi:hypothetical protein XELAEV_18020382mg [Xenopus laevis]|uniref:Uncharacterized protein n=1 Tax=Xenopus laevis TaxID=8355 RepID=A0A974D6X0_XENLA|nr:hypothetical protein XELAEV_18020382mg [Xenopus laevis]